MDIVRKKVTLDTIGTNRVNCIQKVDIYHLRKYEAFTLTQTCKLNVELTVSKNYDLLFSLMSPFKHLYGSCVPQGGKSW